MSTLNDAIIRLYDTVFDRAPDADGLRFWNDAPDHGYSLGDIAGQFITAAEFAATYGAPDSMAFVSAMYGNVLDRPGDADGLAFFARNLDAGLASRADVVVAFSESQEHIAQMAAPAPEAAPALVAAPPLAALQLSPETLAAVELSPETLAAIELENQPSSQPTIILSGGGGDITASGPDGEHIEGGPRADVLHGGAGNDTIIGAAGDDTMTGGGGDDTFVFRRGDGWADVVTDYGPGDHILFPAGQEIYDYQYSTFLTENDTGFLELTYGRASGPSDFTHGEVTLVGLHAADAGWVHDSIIFA